jgi:molybdate transport system substrate-binding protein
VTDVNATGGNLKAIDLPEELEPQVTYGAGVPTEAREPELGQKFIDALTLGPCASALEDAGFGPSP